MQNPYSNLYKVDPLTGFNTPKTDYDNFVDGVNNELDLYDKGIPTVKNASNLHSGTQLSLDDLDFSVNGLGGTLLGVGQLGLGVASYLNSKKTADAQRNLMQQQYDTNKYALDKTKADNQHLLEVFNPSQAKQSSNGIVATGGLASMLSK